MKKITSFIVLCILAFMTSGCGGDDVDCTEANLEQNWANEFQAVINAGTAYASDPSSGNCNAYKDALKEYLDVIDDFEECADEVDEQESFNEALKEANDAIDSLQC